MIDSNRKSPFRAASGIAALMLLVILLGVLFWNHWSVHRMMIRRISLDSDLDITDEQLMEMLNIDDASWGNVNTEEVESRLESYPVIRKARVLKAFPDSLKIYLYHRKPLAITLGDSEKGVLPAVFDEEGYIVEVGRLSRPVDLPIISGSDFGKPILGARFPRAVRSVLLDLSEMRKNSRNLYTLISELEILPQRNGAYDLRLYMNHINIPVRVGRDLKNVEFRKLMIVLDILSSGVAGEVVEVDIRGENAVYKRIEENG